MFKKTLLHLNTKSHLKTGKRGKIKGFSESQSIGILFSSDSLEKHKAIKEFVKTLEAEGKNVQVMTYMGKGKENHEFLYDFFTDEDLSFTGKITNETALRFAENHFDYLFHLDLDQNDLIQNILARSNAKCRVGIYCPVTPDEDLYYELNIHPRKDGTFEDHLKEIYHYTKKITGNGN